MYKHLGKSDRLELYVLLNKGYSQRDISKALSLSQSTVSRELRRNVMRRTNEYIPLKADQKSRMRRLYSKYQGMKIDRDQSLKDFVISGLNHGWTPEEISGRLKCEHSIILGFKSIYTWLESARGQKYESLLPSYTWKKRWRKKKSLNSHIPNRISIESRPEIINKRERIGDFEGDTMGKPKYTSQTLVAIIDRKSRYLAAKKVKALKYTIKAFKTILPDGSKSLTLDNGLENIRYEQLGIKTYFCHAYSSWEKGSIENSFQRLRRYIPKKSDLANFSNEYIAFIINQMNNTPRKCLDYRTPAEVFKDHLHH
jgi:transposase, IS30 family